MKYRPMKIMIMDMPDHEPKKCSDEENLKKELIVRKPLEDIRHAPTDQPGQDKEV